MYSFEIRDKELVNKEFDKLHKTNKLKWIVNPIKFDYFIFIAWRDIFQKRKNKIVTNIKKLNAITEFNIYFMFLQFNIIVLCANCMYINIINGIQYFHQFLIRKQDREKFIFVIHKNQKISNVMFFDFKKSSSYVQHQLNAMLKPFKNFAKIYINDIVMFSKMFDEHFEHFTKIFQFFKNHNVSVFFIKSFFNFFDIILLG